MLDDSNANRLITKIFQSCGGCRCTLLNVSGDSVPSYHARCTCSFEGTSTVFEIQTSVICVHNPRRHRRYLGRERYAVGPEYLCWFFSTTFNHPIWGHIAIDVDPFELVVTLQLERNPINTNDLDKHDIIYYLVCFECISSKNKTIIRCEAYLAMGDPASVSWDDKCIESMRNFKENNVAEFWVTHSLWAKRHRISKLNNWELIHF